MIINKHPSSCMINPNYFGPGPTINNQNQQRPSMPTAHGVSIGDFKDVQKPSTVKICVLLSGKKDNPLHDSKQEINIRPEENNNVKKNH